MIFTLGHARTFCQDAIGSGVNPAGAKALGVINEATMHLINEGHWRHTIKPMQIRTYNNTVPCPEFVKAILKVNFSDRPAFVHSQWYEFMDGGPGTLMNNQYNTNANDLADQGMFPTFFPIGDTAMKLIAFSTDPADTLKTIRIRGLNSNFETVSPTTPGELLAINHWGGGVEGVMNNPTDYTTTTSGFREVLSIVKPVTAGYVSLYAVDFSLATTVPEILFLGKYGPNETSPSYRRYKMTATSYLDEECVIALCKIGYVPLVYDSDPLLIQNLPAIKSMCRSVHEMNHGDLKMYREYKADALALLDAELRDGSAPEILFDVDVEMSMGSLPCAL